ncbi:hypothetical protein FACS1894160_0390 [Bacteroidia bacterium]|nr:hypothetical protein FACS1894123_10740 [Bacteroidia bacterium]GHV07574.1 hypothetical protein FACS1894160_0390 [Bacteroidia bacterium]
MANAESQEEFKLEITKDFSVGSDPNLHIVNKYGNIRIVEGQEKKITFQIEITGKGKTRELAKSYAESVSIDFSANGNLVSAMTNLSSINCNNCGRTINYVVVAPKSVTLNLENKYGGINLDNVIKPLTIDLQYGSIDANSLITAKIDLKYGQVAIQVCEQLNLVCKYSQVNLGKMKTLKIDSKYDNIWVESVSDFRLETGYTNVKIGKLQKSFVCNELKYGKFSISEVAPDFSQIKIDAAYTNVKISLDSNFSFRANLSTKYGEIHAEKLTFNKVSLSKDKNTTFSGIVGKDSNPSATVDISVSYGDIDF